MNLSKHIFITLMSSCILYVGCKVPALVQSPQAKAVAPTFGSNSDTTNTADIKWQELF